MNVTCANLLLISYSPDGNATEHLVWVVLEMGVGWVLTSEVSSEMVNMDIYKLGFGNHDFRSLWIVSPSDG